MKRAALVQALGLSTRPVTDDAATAMLRAEMAAFCTGGAPKCAFWAWARRRLRRRTVTEMLAAGRVVHSGGAHVH